MNKPLISVVMVICNVDRFLAEAIESILAQSFRDFEFIIVDFGSADNSKAIALHYAAEDTRIKFHEIPHCGLAEARNAGCALAQARYIAIMDADDVSLPDRLMLEFEFMEKNPETGLLGGANVWIDATGRPLCVNYFPAEDDEIRQALDVRCPFCQPTVLVRREAFQFVGGYRPAFAPTEDYDLWFRIAEHFQCANLRSVLLKYRIHPYQVSMRKRRQQALGMCAAQVSASLRSDRRPDQFDSVREITSELLASVGVTEVALQNEFFSGGCQWVRNMCMAGEYSVAFNAAQELLESDLKYVERWQISNLYLIVARLHLRQKRLLSSLLALGRALVTRPAVAGRPLKLLLQRLGLT